MESNILEDYIISCSEKKKVYMIMCLILNGYQKKNKCLDLQKQKQCEC